MLTRILRPASVTLAVVCGSSLALEAQKPAVADVLKKAGEYLVQYADQLGTVVAEEEFTQRDTVAANLSRRLVSEFVLVGLDDGSVAAFRDIFSVDGTQVRERESRLPKLLAAPATAEIQAQAQAIGDEGIRYYISPNLRSLDNPTLALEFLRPAHQELSEFSVEGVRRSDGAQVATLKFKARDTSPVMPTPAGSTTSGRFWVDVADGTVRQTEIIVSSKQFTFKATTKFARDAGLGLWVPSELVQLLDISTAGSGGFSNMGEGGGTGIRQSLDARARYSNYRRVGN